MFKIAGKFGVAVVVDTVSSPVVFISVTVIGRTGEKKECTSAFGGEIQAIKSRSQIIWEHLRRTANVESAP